MYLLSERDDFLISLLFTNWLIAYFEGDFVINLIFIPVSNYLMVIEEDLFNHKFNWRQINLQMVKEKKITNF